MFDDSDKVGANVALLPGCTQGYIPNPVEGPREVYEDLGKVLLVLEMFVTACSFNLFSMLFSITLLGWLLRPIVPLLRPGTAPLMLFFTSLYFSDRSGSNLSFLIILVVAEIK